MTHHPRAEVTARARDGFPIEMRVPECGQVYLATDGPTVPIVLADDVTLRTSSVAYLDDLESALQVARTRLVLWLEDHHPGRGGALR